MSTLSEEEKADLVAYLDGELDEEAAATLEAKLARDPEARAEAEALKQAWAMLDYLPKAPPSPNFTNRTLEKLSLEKRTGTPSTSRPIAAPARRWKVGAAWAAALLAACGAGLGAGFLLWPAPREIGPGPDEEVVRNLHLLEKLRWYEAGEDLDFLRQLDHPDLFGDDSTSRGI